jgi:hypothetical protein
MTSVILGCGGGGGGSPNATDTGAAPGTSGNGAVSTTAVTGTGTGGADPGTPAPPSGTTLWAQNYGDEGEQDLAGLAVDGAGNVYVAGNEAPPFASGTGVFLLQYSSTGVLRWRQPFPAPSDSTNALQVVGVAVQPTTGVEILAGTIRGTVTVGDATLTSGVDPSSGLAVDNLWLTAVDSAGYLVWTKVIAGPGYVFPQQVFVTATGDIEVTGGMTDNATVGGAPLCCGNGVTGPRFVARFSPKGDPIWSYGVTGYFRPVSSGTDADGGLVVAGFAEGPFGYRGESFSSGGNPYDTFSAVVLRLDPQGAKRWIQTYINTSGTSMAGAALDRAQNVVVYGHFSGPFDMGGGHVLNGPATSSGQMDGFIAKLAPDGTTQWAQAVPGGLGQQFYASVATDVAGDIALMNSGDGFSAGPSFGGVSPLPAQSTGHFIAKLAPDGMLLWARGFPTTSSSAPPFTGLAFDPSGRLAAAGDFDNTVDFGTGPLTVSGPMVQQSSSNDSVLNNVFTLLLAP